MKVQFRRNNNGVFGTPVDVNRGISQDPSCKWWLEAWNAQSRFTGDGSHVGYNNGCKIIKGMLVINLVSQTDADNFRTFLAEEIQFIRPFSIITSLAGGADLGLGPMVPLLECYVDGTASTEDIIEPLGRGGKYTIRLPYVCLDLVTLEGSFP